MSGSADQRPLSARCSASIPDRMVAKIAIVKIWPAR